MMPGVTCLLSTSLYIVFGSCPQEGHLVHYLIGASWLDYTHTE